MQSLEKNKAEIHRVLSGEGFNIALLSETLVHVLETTRKYNMTGYHLIPCSRDDAYGGTAIMLRNENSYSRIDIPVLSTKIQVVAILILSINLVIFSVYVSPSISIADFKNDIQTLFDKVRQFDNAIVGGDFNEHHGDCGDQTMDRKG